jgi:hypothetical protein
LTLVTTLLVNNTWKKNCISLGRNGMAANQLSPTEPGNSHEMTAGTIMMKRTTKIMPTTPEHQASPLFLIQTVADILTAEHLRHHCHLFPKKRVDGT